LALTTTMKIKRMLKDFIIGLFMGGANIIPGVSGGTVALVMGIYDKLIHSINEIPKDIPVRLIKLDLEGVKSGLKKIDFPFLGALFIGALTAVVSIARILSYLIEAYPSPTYALFFGLIGGSVILIYKYIDELNLKSVLSAVIGFAAISLLLSVQGGIESDHPVMIFFGGMFSVASMILPGISGSYILMILGQYEFLLKALYGMDLLIITIFMAGAFTGLFGLAKLLDHLLERARSLTIAFLFGLMLGALREPLFESISEATSLKEVVVPAVIGIIAVLYLEHRYVLED